MLQNLLLSLDIFVCAALVAVVLMQRSEGGALGTSSGPTGLITTRGAGDLLTRTTWGLAIAFALLSLALTIVEGRARSNDAILGHLKLQTINPDAIAPHPATPAPPQGVPLAPVGAAGSSPVLGLAPQAPVAAPTSPPIATPAVQHPAQAAPAAARTPAPHAAATPKPVAAAPAPAAAAPAPTAAAAPPPVVVTPPPRVSPQSAPSSTPAPKTDGDAPVAHHEP